MSYLRYILLLPLVLCFALPSMAQSERRQGLGAFVGTQVSADLAGNMSIKIAEELRFDPDAMQLNRWVNSIGLDYAFLHNRMHVTATGAIIRRNKKHDYFETRSRFSLDLSYSESIRRFKLTYRTRLVSTFFDEQTGEHRINPKTSWKNQLKATYQMPGSRFKYTLSTELRWPVFDPQHPRPDNLKSIFSVDYRISRHHSIATVLQLNDELSVKEPTDRLYLGICWKMKY